VLTKNEQFKSVTMNVTQTKIDNDINVNKDKDNKVNDVKNDNNNNFNVSAVVSKEYNLIDF